MTRLLSGRSISTIGLFLGITSMAFAIGYLQMVQGLPPCPLCILDRLAALLSLTGIGICARHIWLQNLPKDQVPECGAGFWYMLDTMPALGFLDTILNGSGECADIQWQFLGLSIPELTLILFVVFLLLSLAMFFTPGNRPIRQETKYAA